MSDRSSARNAHETADAVDLLLVHPYMLARDDPRYYELLPYPPLGLLSIAAAARAMGYSVAIHDATFTARLEEVDEAIRRRRPRLVGLGAWSSFRANARDFLEHFRSKGIPIVAGGPDSTLYPQDYLRAGADLVVLSEGEATVRDLLPVLLGPPGSAGGSERRPPVVLDRERLAAIPGLVFASTPVAAEHRTAPRERMKDFSGLPLPAYDLIDARAYMAAYKRKFGYTSLPLMTARGCPYRCTWCARPTFGSLYTPRPVEQVVEEVRTLVETLGAEHLRIIDDTFPIRVAWLHEFARAVREAGLTFRYDCLIRANLVTPAVVADLKATGCVKVYIGVESGSQRVLDAMEKGITVAQVRAARALLRQAGIELHTYLMFGYPSERHRDVRMTMRLLREIAPEEYSISIAYPMPGTKFYDLVRGSMPQERAWVNRDDTDIRFEGEYSNLFYRLARAVAHRRYAPRRPLRKRIEGWMLEPALLAAWMRDEIFRKRGLPVAARPAVLPPAAE